MCRVTLNKSGFLLWQNLLHHFYLSIMYLSVELQYYFKLPFHDLQTVFSEPFYNLKG